MERYDWTPRALFMNRAADLARLEEWWEHSTKDAMGLIGRRRVGKSWLLRRFADGKPAVVLVADRRLLSTQMARFGETLEPELGLRPQLRSVGELVRVLYALGHELPVLAAIDEFPFLLPDGNARDEVLSEVQAVMEEHRDQSQTKLLLCGSLIGQMEGLFAEKSPLHGRLQRLDVWPVTFAEARPMMPGASTAEQRIVRYAVAGGMARYLGELGHGSLRQAVCRAVLDRRGPLFDDVRAVLEMEMRSPATYFSILEALAGAPASTERLTDALQLTSPRLSYYLQTLRDMRLLQSAAPVGAPAGSKVFKHRVADGFVRFWFRFVFPNQESLQEGLSPADLWTVDIEPNLAAFVSSAYEELCARYLRVTYGARAPTVGSWWGPALHRYRRTKERMVEEIDLAGARRQQIVLAGECKWTHSPMPRSVLDELREFKLPAIHQEGRLKLPAAGPEILLFCRSGFAPELVAAAAEDDRVTLVDLDTLVAGLDGETAPGG